MKYRLALKIAHVHRTNKRGESVPVEGALGWAVIRLQDKNTMKTGTTPLDNLQLPPGTPSEVCVVVYSKPEDMLEPMSSDDFEARLKLVLDGLPKGVSIKRIPWDPLAYKNWLVDRSDTSEHRAAWAAQT